MEIWRVPGKGGRYVVVRAILFVPPRSFVRFLEKQSPKLVLAHKTPPHTLMYHNTSSSRATAV